MSYEQRGAMPLDYDLVAYPKSALRFRGPRHSLDPPFVLCLGGAETFGRFIPDPYPAQLRTRLTCPVVNMGVMNAGMDVILGDPAIRHATARAKAVVLQITGAQNFSNRFYTVHPRRNDRFLKATTLLRTVYPDVDFTEFHFTGHLLTHLSSLSRDRFDLVQSELRTAWLARMTRFLAEVPVPVHLLWLSRRGIADLPPDGGLGAAPRFVDADMVHQIADAAASLTVAVPQPGAGPQERPATQGMFFTTQEECAE